jgi:hypothetical protein
MHVRLTAKLAEMMEGVDLSAHGEGDLIELPERDANLLITGGWAERVAREERVSSAPSLGRTVATDRTSGGARVRRSD